MIFAGAIAFLLHGARSRESLLSCEGNADSRTEGETQGNEKYTDDARQPHLSIMNFYAAFVKQAVLNVPIN
jgi:hypothetical protein